MSLEPFDSLSFDRNLDDFFQCQLHRCVTTAFVQSPEQRGALWFILHSFHLEIINDTDTCTNSIISEIGPQKELVLIIRAS